MILKWKKKERFLWNFGKKIKECYGVVEIAKNGNLIKN
jgi:hypothetical protein